MEDKTIFPVLAMQKARTVAMLYDCNRLTEHYGLVLSIEQIQRVTEHRFLALQNTGRVEFSEGILKKLILAFCDSPYLTQRNYEETIIELQDMFYYFKNESVELLCDDELIEAMKSVFDGKAQGSLDYLSGTSLERLCQALRGKCWGEDEEKTWEDEAFDEW